MVTKFPEALNVQVEALGSALGALMMLAPAAFLVAREDLLTG
jgi:hypothetical protein